MGGLACLVIVIAYAIIRVALVRMFAIENGSLGAVGEMLFLFVGVILPCSWAWRTTTRRREEDLPLAAIIVPPEPNALRVIPSKLVQARQKNPETGKLIWTAVTSTVVIVGAIWIFVSERGVGSERTLSIIHPPLTQEEKANIEQERLRNLAIHNERKAERGRREWRESWSKAQESFSSEEYQSYLNKRLGGEEKPPLVPVTPITPFFGRKPLPVLPPTPPKQEELSPFFRGEELPVKTSIAQDLGKAFGFCYGQRRTLSQIHRMFPELKAQVSLATMQWDNALKEAEEGVEARLRMVLREHWDDVRAVMIAQADPILEEQKRNATRDTAISFLELVKHRANGAMESPAREMMLASHPDFVASPGREFANGYTGIFSSIGHPKAHGVDLSIRYPLSWKQFETDRPDIVQKWTSDGGHGTDVFMVQVTMLPEHLTPNEMAAYFTESFAKEMFAEGGNVLSFETKILERLPLGIVHFTQTVERLDVNLEIRGALHYLIHENALISFQFMCYTSEDPDRNEARIKKLEPLITSIVNSVVLSTRFK